MARRGRRGGRGYGREADADGWFGGMDMLLRIGGIKGDCDIPGYEGWIPVLAWSWGASTDVQPASLPFRVRQAIVDKRRLALEAVGLDENGQPIKKDDDGSDDDAAPAASAAAVPAASEPPSYGYGRRGRRGRRQRAPQAASNTHSLLAEKALAELDEDVDFSDSEIPLRPKARANCQDLSCTKYCDIATADIMALVLGQRKGVEMELRVCKSRVKKLTEAEQEAKAAAAAAAAEAKEKAAAENGDESKEKEKEKVKNNRGGNSDNEEEDEPEPEREYVTIQHFTFFDAFISSLSTGGSGGEDRLTENITLTFGGFQYRFVDWQALRAPESKNVPERSIIYDSLRRVVKPYTEVVQKELNKSDQLQPCSSIIMQYL